MICGAPDLIVEVLSPSTGKIDESAKKDLYERHGVIEYLLVYPDEQTVVQYVLEGGFYKNRGIFSCSEEIPLKTLEMKLSLKEAFDI
jgi:Uma2 family endonuclease